MTAHTTAVMQAIVQNGYGPPEHSLGRAAIVRRDHPLGQAGRAVARMLGHRARGKVVITV